MIARSRPHWLVSLAVSVLLAACTSAVSSREAPIAPPPEMVSPDETSSDDRVQIRWFVGLGTGTSDTARAVEEAFVATFNSSQDEIDKLALDLQVICAE
jgi:multiple sugar transport system substrate-binding protein